MREEALLLWLVARHYLSNIDRYAAGPYFTFFVIVVAYDHK